MNVYNALESMCPVCGSTDVTIFFETLEVPVHCNLLWPAREEALSAPRGDIRLGFCADCGHIFNASFDPDLMKYTQSYENSLHFSPRFQDYAGALAKRLVNRFDLHSKDIIEIGCGKGDFLTMLCELGGNRGFGFDPSHVSDPASSELARQVTFVPDFYSERYADYKADLICSRHTLEHIPNPRDFLATIRRAIGGNFQTVVFFEVPNVLFSLRDLAIWDIIYEHCSYFSSSSLRRVFADCGFEVFDIAEGFEGQFLSVEAWPQRRPALGACKDDCSIVAREVADFANRYRAKAETWRQNLEQIKRAGQRAVVWGAGSKGVSFLNTLKVRDQIEYVVDINPRKRGMFVAGAGQQIVSPEFLQDYRPDVVIVMNAVYEDEIRQVAADLGLAGELIIA